MTPTIAMVACGALLLVVAIWELTSYFALANHYLSLSARRRFRISMEPAPGLTLTDLDRFAGATEQATFQYVPERSWIVGRRTHPIGMRRATACVRIAVTERPDGLHFEARWGCPPLFALIPFALFGVSMAPVDLTRPSTLVFLVPELALIVAIGLVFHVFGRGSAQRVRAAIEDALLEIMQRD